METVRVVMINLLVMIFFYDSFGFVAARRVAAQLSENDHGFFCDADAAAACLAAGRSGQYGAEVAAVCADCSGSGQCCRTG